MTQQYPTPGQRVIPSRWYNFEHTIRGKDIVAVEQRHKALGGDGLTITFRRSGGAEEQFLIEMLQAPALERAINVIRLSR